MDKKTVEITVEILYESAGALRVSDGIIEEWIPKSQVTREHEVSGNMVELTIPEWLAIKKGFI